MGLFCLLHDWVVDGKTETPMRYACPFCEVDRLRDALKGIYRGAPRMSHAHLTAAAALDLISMDGAIHPEDAAHAQEPTR